ncbi:hypothetical protein SAMN04515671_3980 [Nakamurella panacisegetis]|uniref:Uncharacterized protein n=1 Tax=Nakamurella panacisegetis TaxID=1090615 RepID=A0A1H0S9Q2_9ACTN|nr:hypothetical protein [Nakamurella panacisegetis]SDP38522.1 hypothetical protein SAMN04515671_3980 [Nakamurella panacisegetis]
MNRHPDTAVLRPGRSEVLKAVVPAQRIADVSAQSAAGDQRRRESELLQLAIDIAAGR